MLILAGSAVIVFAAIRALIHGPELENLGIGIVVIGFASVGQPRGLELAVPPRARDVEPALEGDAAHLRTDAYTSIGVLVGLALVSVTGADWLDPVVALRDRRRRSSSPACGSRWARCACWSTRRCRTTSCRRIRDAIESFADRGVVGYHQLRTRQAGARRYVDLHVQFRHGTTLEEAHRIGHELQDAIQARARRRRRADPPRARGPRAARASAAQNRLMAAAMRDRERHAGVAVVAGEQQDQRRDQADADGDEPGDAGELGHDRGLLSRTPMTAALTPALALDYLHALSADIARRGRARRARRAASPAEPALADARARTARRGAERDAVRGLDATTARSTPRATSGTRSSSSPARFALARADPSRPPDGARRAGRPNAPIAASGAPFRMRVVSALLSAVEDRFRRPRAV